MRILIASPLGDAYDNPLTRLLVESLSKHDTVAYVTAGIDQFWSEPSDVDIVHLHQPEALFKYKEPSPDDLKRLEQQLERWRQRAAVVATIHNEHPHYEDTPRYRALYNLVYERVDGLTHRGQVSADLFNARYPRLLTLPQAIIPCGIYDSFENTVSKQDARRALDLPLDDDVFLAFGTVRHFEEIAQIIAGFKGLTSRRKKLLIAGEQQRRRFLPRRLLRYLRVLGEANVRRIFSLVKAEDVQLYANVADVFVIPRVRILNSANVQLGFTFSRVVVGPDTGVVGEILRATGNPIFTPNDPPSITRALEAGLRLARQGHGDENRRYAETHWNWDLLADAHVNLFRAALAARFGAKDASIDTAAN